jgi:hypothetical protein
MNAEPVMVAAADVIRTFVHGGTAVDALRGVLPSQRVIGCVAAALPVRSLPTMRWSGPGCQDGWRARISASSSLVSKLTF